MSAQPHDPPHDTTLVPYDLNHLYTVEEYLGLPEDDSFKYELQDGVIIVSPRPGWNHQVLSGRLFGQIWPQLPDDLASAPDVDVDIQLPTPVVRAPDLVVVRASALSLGTLTAGDVVLAVEILSPGSIRKDTKDKFHEYEEAGIPNYWVVDPQSPVTATVYRLYEHGYEASQRAEHTFTVEEPCQLTIDLDALLPD